MIWFGSLLGAIILPTSFALSTHVHDGSFTPDIVLRVTLQNITLNCESRLSTLVNGTVPGPTLRIPEGKTTWIRVYNDMKELNTTMHWHGLAQMVAPFSDGSPYASQWPIAPLHYFDYEVRPATGSAGTYFYHSHVDLQANTAAGPLIVESSKPSPYKYDDEKIIYFSDYWNKTDTAMKAGLISANFTWIGEVNNILVNGYGRPLDSKSEEESCTIAPISVEPGKTYRLRFIASTGLSFISFAIEGHDELTIISADGAYTKPLKTSYMQIASGQRYGVLLRTKTEDELKAEGKDTYYLQLKSQERPVVTTAYAAIVYSKKPKLPIKPPAKPPINPPNTTYAFLDYELAPYKVTEKVPSRSEVDRTVLLDVRQLNENSTHNPLEQLIWTVNNYTPWFETTPPKPYLVALYESDKSDLPNYSTAIKNGGFDARTRTFPAKVGEVIDIIIQAVGMGASNGEDIHPFHLHGAHFWDMGSGNGSYDASAHDKLLEQAYAKGWQPPLRDTSMLYRTPGAHADPEVGTNWRAWRIRVTDPGVWMLHCHTLAHMAMGMQSVWVMGDKNQVAPLPKALVGEYLTYGGGSYGNGSYDPKVMHYWDSDEQNHGKS